MVDCSLTYYSSYHDPVIVHRPHCIVQSVVFIERLLILAWQWLLVCSLGVVYNLADWLLTASSPTRTIQLVKKTLRDNSWREHARHPALPRELADEEVLRFAQERLSPDMLTMLRLTNLTSYHRLMRSMVIGCLFDLWQNDQADIPYVGGEGAKQKGTEKRALGTKKVLRQASTGPSEEARKE